MKNIFYTVLFFSGYIFTVTYASTLADGSVMVKKDFVPTGFDDSHYESADDYLQAKSDIQKVQKDTDISYIFYGSDGYRVKGFVMQPKIIPEAKKMPIIVFNRGGNRGYSKIDMDDLLWLNKFVEKGYVVVASDYRETEGGEGKDEFGGKDVNDIKNIVKVAKTLKGVDADHVYSLGFSRGAMMTSLSVKGNSDYTAAAEISGECDLKKGIKTTPYIEKIYNEVIPGYEDGDQKTKDALLKDRSSCAWADQIKTPLLLLRGSDSKTVDPKQSQMLKDAVIAGGNKSVKLETFPGDDEFYSDPEQEDKVVNQIDAFYKQASNHSGEIAPESSKSSQ